MNINAEYLADCVLPDLFNDTSKIGSYCDLGSANVASMRHLTDAMDAGATSKLADLIRSIITALKVANPIALAKKPSRWELFTGRSIEKEANYLYTCNSIDHLIDAALQASDMVRKTLVLLDDMMAANANDSHIIKLHIDSGRLFLQLNLTAGLPEQSDFPFESPRERFKRKLTSLSTLYHSHQMSILQMRFAKASAIALLDRFTETVTVSVPAWRQYNLAMMTAEKMNPDMIAAANKATNVLIKELSAALEAPTKKDE